MSGGGAGECKGGHGGRRLMWQWRRRAAAAAATWGRVRICGCWGLAEGMRGTSGTSSASLLELGASLSGCGPSTTFACGGGVGGRQGCGGVSVKNRGWGWSRRCCKHEQLDRHLLVTVHEVGVQEAPLPLDRKLAEGGDHLAGRDALLLANNRLTPATDRLEPAATAVHAVVVLAARRQSPRHTLRRCTRTTRAACPAPWP